MRLCWLFGLACCSAFGPLVQAQAVWEPESEPKIWRDQRISLVKSYPHLADGWRFMDADVTDSRRVAEYLRNRRRSDDGSVQFEALLMLRRGSSPWRVRSLPMRALCGDGVLQRLGKDQQWETYPARPGYADRVAWICSVQSSNQP